MDNKKYLIVYHLEDNDGCCSAALIKYYLTNTLNVSEDQIGLFPATYPILDKVLENNFGEWAGYDVLIMTDISFNNFSAMEMIYDMFGKANFTWIDHHAPVIKTSIERKYDILINGVRDTSRSAILNAYKYCYDNLDIMYNAGEAPIILRYLSAWDSWTTEKENLDFDKVRNVNTGFTSESQLSVDYWYKIMDIILNGGNNSPGIQQWISDMEERGKKINDAADRKNEELIKNCGIGGFTVDVDNRSCIVLFTSGSTNSLMFKSVRGIYDNAVCFKSSSTGNIIISMYNVMDNHEFHCGNYLHNKYGGGGHEGAAGATISFDTFCNILKTKKI